MTLVMQDVMCVTACDCVCYYGGLFSQSPYLISNSTISCDCDCAIKAGFLYHYQACGMMKLFACLS